MAGLDILTPLQQGLQIRGALQQQGLQRQQAERQAELQPLQLQQQQIGLESAQLGLSQAQRQDTQSQQQERLMSIAQGAEQALTLEGPDRQNFLSNRLAELKLQGRTTESTEDAINIGNQFGFDSPELQSALQQGLATANSFGVLTPQQQAQQAANVKRAAELVKSEGDIRKETRGRVGSAVKGISKAASTVSENASKLTGLVEQIKGGSRTAVSQALVAILKLGDPTSVARESEVAAVLNAPNPLAALSGLSGDTTVIESLIKKMDPLNPTSINTDDLLNTANSLISANVPSIQQQFSEQRQLASSNLTEKGVQSLFPEDLEGRIKGLSDLIKAQPGPKFESTVLGRPVTEQDIKDTLSENPGLTREDLFKQLGIQ